jgi:PAS domain S-box-containing protein
MCRPIFDDNKKYLGRRVSNRDITQKKEIEIELRNSKAKYQELYTLLRLMSDTMPDMLWAKDLDKKYLFANKALCESLLFANDTNEPIGKTDMYFVDRQRRLQPENPEWHTFGELCQDSDAVTLSEMKQMQFDEFGNVKGKFLFLDVHKAPLINDKGELIGTVGSARDITISKAAEKALRESESKNRAFLNAIPDIIFILSQDGIFLDYKSESNDQLLLLPEQFIGKHIRDVLPEKLALLTTEKIGKLFTSRQTQVYEYQIEQNGILKSFENRLVFSGDNQILSIIRDITASKEAEEKIKRLTHAIEQSKVSIVITDVKGKIEYFNPMFSYITGYTYDELKGNDINVISSGTPNENILEEMWSTINTGKGWSGEFLNKKKNGELFWVSANVSPIFSNDGRIINFIAIEEDITEQKKITQELIDAKNKAEEMNKVKSYFFANMSHELRTPFVGILGFSEMLTECLPDPEYKGYAEQILKSAKRLTDTLNKILNITRLEFDRYELSPEDVDINELILETSGLYSQSCKNNNSYIKTNLHFDKKLIKVDRRLAEEILNNLISNAVKFTQDGVIDISNRRIEIENKNVLEIVISDTGLGIPKEMQDIIWQEFRQASEGYSRSFEGTGLGLTITKKYIELLEGNIYLESELGKGSTFTLHIPFEAVDTEIALTDKMNKSKLPAKSQEIQISKPKILYVEDDIISLDYITLVLK